MHSKNQRKTCLKNFFKYDNSKSINKILKERDYKEANVIEEDIQIANKNVKRCLTSLAIRKVQIKTTVR